MTPNPAVGVRISPGVQINFMNEYIKNMKSWIPKVIGLKDNKAIDLINDDGFNCCVYKEDGKIYNEIGSLESTIYLEIENRIVIAAY